MASYQIRQYLRHIIEARSTKGHGIHSPFVYKLATQVLPDQKAPVFEPVEQLRKKLLRDERSIFVNDLGAGSRVHRSAERKVSAIAKFSSKDARIARLLYRLACHLQPVKVLELGTSLGLTTAYLAMTDIPVTTIEGCENIARLATSNFNQLKLSNIKVLVGDFDQKLPEYLSTTRNCHFVFIDGNHSFDATIRYYYLLKQALPDQSLVIFDDIYWSKDMTRAWQEIIADSANQVTVDLFHVGLVFFRKDQAKEHFKIRI